MTNCYTQLKDLPGHEYALDTPVAMTHGPSPQTMTERNVMTKPTYKNYKWCLSLSSLRLDPHSPKKKAKNSLAHGRKKKK